MRPSFKHLGAETAQTGLEIIFKQNTNWSLRTDTNTRSLLKINLVWFTLTRELRIQTATYTEYWMTSSIKGHPLMTALLTWIGSIMMSRLSEVEDGMLSSSYSLILRDCCVELKLLQASFTRGRRQHSPLTVGSVPQHCSDRAALGPFSTSSSSTHRESYTASEEASFIRGAG